MNMKRYRSHKIVKARPMTLGEYNIYRGWKIPDNELASSEGYLVEYEPEGAPNHPGHAGYISWSPKGPFDSGYTEIQAS